MLKKELLKVKNVIIRNLVLKEGDLKDKYVN